MYCSKRYMTWNERGEKGREAQSAILSAVNITHPAWWVARWTMLGQSAPSRRKHHFQLWAGTLSWELSIKILKCSYWISGADTILHFLTEQQGKLLSRSSQRFPRLFTSLEALANTTKDTLVQFYFVSIFYHVTVFRRTQVFYYRRSVSQVHLTNF